MFPGLGQVTGVNYEDSVSVYYSITHSIVGLQTQQTAWQLGPYSMLVYGRTFINDLIRTAASLSSVYPKRRCRVLVTASRLHPYPHALSSIIHPISFYSLEGFDTGPSLTLITMILLLFQQ